MEWRSSIHFFRVNFLELDGEPADIYLSEGAICKKTFSPNKFLFSKVLIKALCFITAWF